MRLKAYYDIKIAIDQTILCREISHQNANV